MEKPVIVKKITSETSIAISSALRRDGEAVRMDVGRGKVGNRVARAPPDFDATLA
jgi:hypothetical protein